MSERSKVSNELLTIAAEDEALNPVQIASLWRIADRIDAEMMELPKDADGVPIRVGDTVYTPSGNTADVASIHFHVMCSFNGGIPTTFLPTDLTHSNHDTLERIADDIEECEREAIIDRSSLSNFAKRIRRLAKEDESGDRTEVHDCCGDPHTRDTFSGELFARCPGCGARVVRDDD